MNKKLISLIAGAAIVAAATGCSGTATSSVAGTSSAAGTSASEASSTAAEELSGTLSMNGSTSMEKVIKAVNGAFMEKNKGVTVNLNLTGSGTGIQEASEGKCDIGNSSRKLKDEEAEKLDATVVGLDGIALVVNPANKLEDITLQDLAKVYSGEITNVDETVKALKVGGVEATEENVKSGAYKVQRPFICATLKGSDNKLVKAYLDFILSEEGQALVLAQGAVPVK